MAKKYYWLKLKSDFFKSKTMKKLRKIAGGDTYTIIYLKLQLLSLQDEGKLFFENIEENFAEELALEIDEEPDNVQFTLLFLQKCGLLEYVNEDEIMLHEVPLAIGKETESAVKMRKSRAKKALETKQSQCDQSVIPCDTEIEIEIEKDIDIEKEKRERVNYQQIADMYNDTCVSFPKVQSLSETRKKSIKARLNTYTLADFKLVFEKAEASDFLRGKNGRDWQANFDWLIKDANMAKVLDGNYDNKGQAPKKVDDNTQKQVDAYLAANQQETETGEDFDEKMKRLLEENGLF